MLRNECGRYQTRTTTRSRTASSRRDLIFPTPPFSGLALFRTVNSSGLSLFSLRRIRTALVSTRSFQRRPFRDWPFFLPRGELELRTSVLWEGGGGYIVSFAVDLLQTPERTPKTPLFFYSSLPCSHRADRFRESLRALAFLCPCGRGFLKSLLQPSHSETRRIRQQSKHVGFR